MQPGRLAGTTSPRVDEEEQPMGDKGPGSKGGGKKPKAGSKAAGTAVPKKK
ncbi:MAG: hypothetical protein H0W07_00190 [Chloroflexi bacterium]|nr:hypothetical protein [Chloroflexota bacterium]